MLDKARRRRRLALTPLIDVIFLLLLFFMLSSTFSRFSEVELAAARAGNGDPTQGMRFLQLAPTALTLDGEPLALDDLAAALKGGNVALVVSLGQGVSAQRLTDLLVVLHRVPDSSVTVLGAS